MSRDHQERYGQDRAASVREAEPAGRGIAALDPYRRSARAQASEIRGVVQRLAAAPPAEEPEPELDELEEVGEGEQDAEEAVQQRAEAGTRQDLRPSTGRRGKAPEGPAARSPISRRSKAPSASTTSPT